MSAAEVLHRAREAGVTVTVEGERLKFRADRKPPDDLIAALRQHKPAIMALLTSPVAPVIGTIQPCRRESLTMFVNDSEHLYRGVLVSLERQCPDGVPQDRWRQCIEDGERFIAAWGEQAQALGWTAADLFGLHTPPVPPHWSYSRLSRYDATGLIWLLRGERVLAMTATTATLTTSSGGTLTYRRFNKPALGPPGDSLDDSPRAQ